MADYVKNKDLYLEICRCQDASLNASPELIKMFTLMSERYSRKFTYKYETDRQDCIQGGIMDCYQYWNRFDRTRTTNAFAYISSIVANGQKKVFRELWPDEVRGVIHISLSNNNIYSL